MTAGTQTEPTRTTASELVLFGAAALFLIASFVSSGDQAFSPCRCVQPKGLLFLFWEEEFGFFVPQEKESSGTFQRVIPLERGSPFQRNDPP